MYKFLSIVYFEDKFVLFEDVKIFVVIYVFYYGMVVFGGLWGIFDLEDLGIILLFCLDCYGDCLSKSVKFLYYDISVEKIKEVIVDFVKKN